MGTFTIGCSHAVHEDTQIRRLILFVGAEESEPLKFYLSGYCVRDVPVISLYIT